jgi:hypothetical protein
MIKAHKTIRCILRMLNNASVIAIVNTILGTQKIFEMSPNKRTFVLKHSLTFFNHIHKTKNAKLLEFSIQGLRQK